MSKELLTREDAAIIIGVSQEFVRLLILNGRLPATRGRHREYLIDRDSVVKYAQRRRNYLETKLAAMPQAAVV